MGNGSGGGWGGSPGPSLYPPLFSYYACLVLSPPPPPSPCASPALQGPTTKESSTTQQAQFKHQHHPQDPGCSVGPQCGFCIVLAPPAPMSTEKRNLRRASFQFRLAVLTELHLIGPPTTAIRRHSRHNLSSGRAHGFLSPTAMHRHNRHRSSSTIAPGFLAAQWGPRCCVHPTLVPWGPMMAKYGGKKKKKKNGVCRGSQHPVLVSPPRGVVCYRATDLNCSQALQAQFKERYRFQVPFCSVGSPARRPHYTGRSSAHDY